MLKRTGVLGISVGMGMLMTTAGLAEAPALQSGTPVIHLADNLDEKDKLGWCIDTVGRGFAEVLHAHSCKPARENAQDTQFSYDPSSGQIRSVAFDGKCMVVSDSDDPKKPFGLVDCATGDPAQQFVYDSDSMEIRIGTDTATCVAVGAQGRSAGPFLSRDLVLSDCAATDGPFKQWVVLD